MSSGGVYQVMGKPVPVKAGPVFADRKTRSAVHIVPDIVACEGTTTVTVIFDEVPESSGGSGGGRVEVSVRSKEKIDRIVAKQINRRTFSFTAPENREGDASAVVFVNESEVASFYLHYQSDTVHLVAGLSQIYLQFLSTVCRYMYTLQTKHQIQSPIPELDRLLAESFEDSDNKHNIPPKALEELFDIFRYSSAADFSQSKYEFPTLLHVAGEYGLNQLAVKLLDLPGSAKASNIFNHNRRTAAELATNNGHHLVATTLGSSNKVHCPVETRISSATPARSSKVMTLMPGNRPKPNQEGDYMLPDRLDAATPDFEDNYAILTQQQLSSTMGVNETPRKPPPNPCQKFVQSKSVPTVFPPSQSDLPKLQPRLSGRTAAAAPPIVPRRESRDSGVNVDDPPGPPQTPTRQRPPVSKGDSDPVFVYSDEGHYVPIRKISQDVTGNTVHRNISIPNEEIARQLRKPVHPQPGARGPSVTK